MRLPQNSQGIHTGERAGAAGLASGKVEGMRGGRVAAETHQLSALGAGRSKVHQNQEKKPFRPPRSLQCPVLEKLKIVPADKGEIFQDHTQAKRVGFGSGRQYSDNWHS